MIMNGNEPLKNGVNGNVRKMKKIVGNVNVEQTRSAKKKIVDRRGAHLAQILDRLARGDQVVQIQGQAVIGDHRAAIAAAITTGKLFC